MRRRNASSRDHIFLKVDGNIFGKRRILRDWTGTRELAAIPFQQKNICGEDAASEVSAGAASHRPARCVDFRAPSCFAALVDLNAATHISVNLRRIDDAFLFLQNGSKFANSSLRGRKSLRKGSTQSKHRKEICGKTSLGSIRFISKLQGFRSRMKRRNRSTALRRRRDAFQQF